MSLDSIIQIVIIVSALLLVLTILLQQRGATLGAGFGSSGELFTARRGIDKTLFDISVFLTTIFLISIMAAILIPR